MEAIIQAGDGWGCGPGQVRGTDGRTFQEQRQSGDGMGRTSAVVRRERNGCEAWVRDRVNRTEMLSRHNQEGLERTNGRGV